ncbi:MAG: type II toxin-antitoxin system prevent-host-death family antitoxin [Gammaproteobacteria bacterium]|nr:type II toxin-antitoxin system prevent-host-death family antitoxin [Gammaproteobacteria bacterium]
MKQVNIAQAKAQLSELVKRAVAGEVIVIARDNKPLVKLVNIATETRKARTPGSAKGAVTMKSDFGKPLNDFARYR